MAICLLVRPPSDTTFNVDVPSPPGPSFSPDTPAAELPSAVYHYLAPELSEVQSVLNYTIDPFDSIEFFADSLKVLKGQINRARQRASNEPQSLSVRSAFEEVLPGGARRPFFHALSKDQLESTLDEFLRLIRLAEEGNLA